MSTGNKPDPDEINLKECIEQFAWNRFRETHGFFTRLFTLKNRYYVDIKWDYMNFDHKTTTLHTENSGDAKNVELYFCEYENKTDDEQVHKFSTSRLTTATTSVTFQKSYTLGAEANIQVNLGSVKLGGVLKGGLTITNTNGQSFSESLTWNIDTEIKVPAKQKAIAKLHVSEDQSVIDFEVETTVTLPKKKFPVSIRRISDDKLMGQTIWILNLKVLKEYLKEAQGMVELKENPEKIGDKTYMYTALVLKSHGTARTISFKNQNVTVECTPLPGDKSWKKNQAEKMKKDKAESVDKDGESPQ